MATVSINTLPPVEDDPKVSIDTVKTPPELLPKDEVADQRAFKAKPSFLDRTESDIRNQLMMGNEGKLRLEAASNRDFEIQQMKQKAVVEYAKQKGGFLTPEDHQKLDFLLNPGIPSAPDSVLEEKFGKEAMKYFGMAPEANQSSWGWEDTLFGEVRKANPAATEALMNKGSESVTKREYALKLSQDLEKEMEDRSWLPSTGLPEPLNTALSTSPLSIALGIGLGKSSKITDALKTMVPFYEDYYLRGNVDGVTPITGVLRGQNIYRQTRDLLRSDFPEFKQKVDDIYASLKGTNPELAQKFLHYIVGASTSDIAMDDVMGAADVLGVPVFKMFKRGVDAVIIARAIKDAARGTTGEVSKATIAGAAGDIGEATVSKAATELVAEASGKPIEPAKQAVESLPTYLRTARENLGTDPGRFGQEGVNRLSEMSKWLEGTLLKSVQDILRVERVPGFLAAEKAIRLYKEGLKELYPGLKNVILDINGPLPHPHLSNVYRFEMEMGETGTDLFTKETTAHGFIERHGLLDAEVRPQGAGYKVVVSRNLDETSDIVRDFLARTSLGQSPNNTLTAWGAWLRSPEDTLSFEQNLNRKVASYGRSIFYKIHKENAQAIVDLARGVNRFDPETGQLVGFFKRESKALLDKITPVFYDEATVKIDKDITIPGVRKPMRTTKAGKRYYDWERVINASDSLIDPVSGKPGYWFKNPAELEDFYQKFLKRAPDPVETEAYFAYVRAKEMEAILQDLLIFKNQSRLGAQQWRFHTVVDEKKRVNSDFFVGMKQKEIPSGDDGILVVGDKLGKERVYLGTVEMDTKFYNELVEDVKNGARNVIRIYDPETKPLKNFGLPGASGLVFNKKLASERIRYVIAPNVESKELAWSPLERRGGRHQEVDYNYYVKQAKINGIRHGGIFQHWYEGDTTVMPVMLQTMGKDIAEKLDKVRLALREGDTVLAKKITEDELRMNWKEVNGWFRKHKKDGEIMPPRLSMREPIQVVPKDRMIVDMNKDLENRYPNTFRDGSKSGSDARQYQVQYTQQRDAYELFTIQDEGRRHNPLYKVAPARMVDPVTTMNRAMSRIINSTYFDDYKVFSVENWLREAASSLKNSESEMRYSPFHVFNDPQWKSGADLQKKLILQSAHFNIKQLIGIPSTIDTALHSMAQKALEYAYGNLGPKALVIDPSWLLPKLRDPFGFVRSIAFHSKLGLFAVPQLIVQLQTYASILGYAGSKYAVPGTQAAMIHAWRNVNKSPEILDHMDKLLSKMRIPGSSGWRVGEFKESVLELEKTGFRFVGAEYADANAHMNPKVLTTAWGRFLDLGQTFFQMGERGIRYGAWHTAFKEFRDKFPTTVLTDQLRREILQRADLLSSNMSRASSSVLHTGIMSIPAQFYSYQLRQAELFLGKRIGETATERAKVRARVLATYATLYGVPSATGISGFPFGDYIRSAALDKGYVIGDKWMQSMFMEGLPALAVALATGGGDIQKGEFLNFGDRYGVQGFELLREGLRGDRQWWEVAGGAGYSVFKDAFQAGSSLTKAVISQIVDKPGERTFPVVIEDVIDAGKSISSVNAANRLYVALATSKWISKNEINLSDVNPYKAVIWTATGLQPQDLVDMHIKAGSIHDEKKAQDDALKLFTKEVHRAIEATKNKHFDQGQAYFTRATAILDAIQYPEDKLPAAWSIALKDAGPLGDTIDLSYYTKHVKAGTERDKFNAYSRRLILQQLREGN